jgi:hypothetical protein
MMKTVKERCMDEKEIGFYWKGQASIGMMMDDIEQIAAVMKENGMQEAREQLVNKTSMSIGKEYSDLRLATRFTCPAHIQEKLVEMDKNGDFKASLFVIAEV